MLRRPGDGGDRRSPPQRARGGGGGPFRVVCGVDCCSGRCWPGRSRPGPSRPLTPESSRPGLPLRTLISADLDGGLAGTGAPPVLRGRLPRLDAAGEIAINEGLAGDLGLSPGDTTVLSTYSVDEPDAASDGSEPPRRPGRPALVTGVVRDFVDLVPEEPSALLTISRPLVVYTTPAWWRSEGSGAFVYGAGSLVRLKDGPDSVHVPTHEPSRSELSGACGAVLTPGRAWAGRAGGDNHTGVGVVASLHVTEQGRLLMPWWP